MHNLAHINAQSAAWFVVGMFVVGAIAIWLSWKQDKED